MNDLFTIKKNDPSSKNQSQTSNLIRWASSSLSKRSMKICSKPPSLFPSDFFSSGDEENDQSQKAKSVNQPILPNSTNISVLRRPLNQAKSIPSKVVIDFQKEFDEDKELLALLQGETNHRPNSEEHSTKPFSSCPKRLNKQKVECEIIPEVDEEKMRTSTKIFYEDNAANKNNSSNHNSNSHNKNFNISPQKKKATKAIEKNNESLSTANVTYESIMKPKSKMKRRYHSGDSKTSKINIMGVNYKKIDIINSNNNPLKQLVLPSIKKKNPYTEYQKKFENLFDNLGDFSEEEHIKPNLNRKMQNIGDIGGVLMKKEMQRGKMGSAPHGEYTYLRKSPSTNSIPQINKSKMNLNNNDRQQQHLHQQQHNKMNMKNTSYLNGSHHHKTKSINYNTGQPSPNKRENKKELNHKTINYKFKQLPVKVIAK